MGIQLHRSLGLNERIISIQASTECIMGAYLHVLYFVCAVLFQQAGVRTCMRAHACVWGLDGGGC